MKDAPALFRLLGDDARLRLLRLVAEDRLNVTELTGILGIAQSGVSRHLGLLRESGLVEERREGGFVYYQATSPASRNGLADVWQMLEKVFASTAHEAAAKATRAPEGSQRLRRRLRDARRRAIVPGRGWAAWARAGFSPAATSRTSLALRHLAIEAAGFARQVIAIDRSREVLVAQGAREAPARRQRDVEAGRARRLRCRMRRWTARCCRRRCITVAPCAERGGADRTARRPRHVLDLRRHAEAWVRERFGDKWLGFDDQEPERLLTDAGLSNVRVTTGASLAGDPFTVLVASGTK